MPEGLFPFQHGGDSKGISVYIHLYKKVWLSLVQLRREAPYIWDDFLFLLLLLLFTQTYSICHGNGLITCMCVIYMSWCGDECYYKYVLCLGVFVGMFAWMKKVMLKHICLW